MRRRTALLVLCSLLATAPAAGQSAKLNASEIEVLLTGNTAVGTWEGQAYRQYFEPDGTTIFAQNGVRSSRGEWRIDSARDEYQSIWPSDVEWEGWYVMEYLGDYFWVSKTTPPTPFKILEGQRLAFVPE